MTRCPGKETLVAVATSNNMGDETIGEGDDAAGDSAAAIGEGEDENML